MICLADNVEEIILRLLKKGDNDLKSFRKRLFFLSNNTLSKTLFNLNNRGIIILDIKKNNIYFKEKYFKIVYFLEKTNFVEGINNFLEYNSRLNNLLFSLLHEAGLLKELNQKNENYNYQNLLAKCLNVYYKDSFSKEIATLKIRFHRGDKNNAE